MVDALAALKRRDAVAYRTIMHTTPPDALEAYWRARRAFRAAQRHDRAGATPRTFRRLMVAGQRVRYASLAIYHHGFMQRWRYDGTVLPYHDMGNPFPGSGGVGSIATRWPE